MSISPLNNLALSGLQSILGNLGGGSSTTSAAQSSSSAGIQSSDNSQLSPFAQLLTTLQQLQQSNPTQYQQVTQQIASNLQTAAKTAQSDGNTTLANQLNQLSTDFSSASQNAQLPNVQDLAQAMSGGHHHHHGGHGGGSSASSGDSSNPMSQFLASIQADQNNSLNPMSIITNTLSSAGISIGS
jgi:hypothetical protein